tara:strand:- start:4495 stop:6351 length:1857 start_codon:yes stop_codon:yes gene_type:complete
MAIRRDINYINKDFAEYRNTLINYSQTYFPTTYTDFSETSPGMMFIEQAAYVGDVLSFYLDNQVQETYLQYARQDDNLYDLAYMYGYKPKATGLAITSVDFFQQVPSKLSGSAYVPDFDYALYVNQNTVVSTTAGSSTSFTTDEPIDFSVSNSLDPTIVSVAQVSAGNPTYYLLKKTRRAFSGVINNTSVTFGAPEEFATTEINGTNLSNIIDVFDSDGNQWYEVDYLGQDAVYTGLKNVNTNDPNTYTDADTPYILQTKRVQTRFATRFLNANTLQLQFGAGSPTETTENVIPNPDNVGLGLPFGQSKLTTAYSPTNFVFTNTYGIAPSNTTLTIRYYTGGGVQSNIPSNTLTNPTTSTIQFLKGGLDPTTAQYVFDSIATNNPIAASGGQDGDTIEEIRQNSISNFPTQLRNVTSNDYLIRALSMPPKFGVISKAWAQKPLVEDINDGPSATLDIYLLSSDLNGKLTTASQALKENVKTYINEYRMISDTISIKNAFVINFNVNFEIITFPNYNGNQVVEECILELKDYFSIDKWQINQPIIISNLFVLLDQVEGVQTVKQVNLNNVAGTSQGYSKYAYDMNGALQNGTIFPSLDPSIFELKYPDNDIKGRVVTLF